MIARDDADAGSRNIESSDHKRGGCDDLTYALHCIDLQDRASSG